MVKINKINSNNNKKMIVKITLSPSHMPGPSLFSQLRKVKERELEKGERKNACFTHTYPFKNADKSQR